MSSFFKKAGERIANSVERNLQNPNSKTSKFARLVSKTSLAKYLWRREQKKELKRLAAIGQKSPRLANFINTTSNPLLHHESPSNALAAWHKEVSHHTHTYVGGTKKKYTKLKKIKKYTKIKKLKRNKIY